MPAARQPGGVRQADAAGQAGRWQRAVAIGRRIERARLDWFLEPEIRFPLAAAYRGLGDTRAADRLYQDQGQRSRDGWWRCAQGELAMRGLAGAGQVANRPLQSKTGIEPPVGNLPHGRHSSADLPRVLWCVRARVPPHLDGRLDDAVWREAKQAALASALYDDANWPAVVMLAYDDKYLYVAARCREPPHAAGTSPSPTAPAQGAGSRPDGGGVSAEESQAPRRRPRDGDLSAYDRVELMFDIDRDFAVDYHLAVDRRGWTFDRCWEDQTWDPQWYVATRREAGSWTVEAAIPLKELTGKPPKPRDVWALGVQRVVPGVGFQSWTTPAAAAAALPDGFGYLVFQ